VLVARRGLHDPRELKLPDVREDSSRAQKNIESAEFFCPMSVGGGDFREKNA